MTLDKVMSNAFHIKLNIYVHRVGFEPTKSMTTDLKSAPLDQLGHLCIYGFELSAIIIHINYILRVFNNM